MRSVADAEKLAKKSTLTAEQVIQRAKCKLDLPIETWEHVEETLAGIARRNRRVHYAKILQNTTVRAFRAHRRMAIAFLIALVTLAFFTLIPVGRTMAKSAFDYIANVFETYIRFEPSAHMSQEPEYVAVEDDSSLDGEIIFSETTIVYKDFETFSSEFGLQPIQFVSDNYICTRIIVTQHETMGLSLSSQYSSPDGDVVFTQEWLTGDCVNAYINNESWEKTYILDGVELYYSSDNTDGRIDGFAVLNDSLLWITAQPSVDIINELSNIAY
jgi:hypothetical protein